MNKIADESSSAIFWYPERTEVATWLGVFLRNKEKGKSNKFFCVLDLI
jgi:hypothetical protein